MTTVTIFDKELEELAASAAEEPSDAADRGADEGLGLKQLLHQQSQELEQAQSRVRLAERLAALGNLSAGIAHDMGNLLLPIRVRLDALQAKLVDHAAREDLEAIREAVQHLQRLANGLRLFSLDPQEGTRNDHTSLAEWWLDVEPFLRHALGRGARIAGRFPEGLPEVKVSRHRLTQAVYNLVQNSAESFKQRNGASVEVSAEERGEFIELRVQDNGSGMSEVVSARCMEPFFTTKPRSLTTGLGLSLVHGIVQKAGGSMHIASAEGEGTTVSLLLCRHVPVEASAQGSAGRVLVDLKDLRVRSYLSALLRSQNYEVAAEQRTADSAEIIWISDELSAVEQLRAFAARSGSWAILMNDQPVEGGNRLICLPLSPKPSVFRETLERIARERTE